jgi:mannose-6-phosphate isomerase-like protein (cupin superfamily)
MEHPYENMEVTKEFIIRKFSKHTTAEELLWHRDRENRLVEVLSGRGWYFQYDNTLPFKLTKNHVIDIPAGCWHRLHRGITDLVIKIKFY